MGYKQKAKEANIGQALYDCLLQGGVFLVIYLINIFFVVSKSSSY